ncbi:MAG: PhoPQ-activated pathogenicity-like protein PqaA type, partial [Bacteroidaceae bacterium]|nr:PhoPQ-activated pathogenicity-like protein PqaA type [Bacteroidaceae bacterium]
MNPKFLLPLLLIFASALRAVEPESALYAYLHNGDDSYSWEVIDSTQEADIRAYRLQLTSQTWRGIPWHHELVVLIPQRVRHGEALLHVSGGSEDEQTGRLNLHAWDESLVRTLGRIAHNCQAVTAILWQVPRQPLFGGLKEDELVSYTFHQYQQTGDATWPLLFPMAKSVLKAMDAVSELAASRHAKKHVGRFVINGVSKRGWTTWMSAATGDPRIVAIAPMVIDILRMPVSVAYQKHMYGRYSAEIQDYVNLGLTETVSNPEGRALVEMVDPYSYRQRFGLPKFIFMDTNDPYWTVDAVKNYIGGLPGHTQLNYTPNAGHDLAGGKDASIALEAFFHQTI